MKNQFFTYIFIFSTLSFSACTKKDTATNGVDNDGNCNYTFTYDYNQVVQATIDLEKAYVEPINIADITEKQKELNHVCSVVKYSYKGTSCNAKIESTAATVIASYEDLRPNCAVSDTIEKNKKDQKPDSTKPFTGKENKRIIVPVKDEPFLRED